MKRTSCWDQWYIGKTEYSLVYLYKNKYNKDVYEARYNNRAKQFKDIKEAAKWIDLRLIEDNKEPRNILTKKMKKAAIIIENRNIKNLDKTIDNHMKFLPGWELIHLRPDHVKTRQDYNKLLTSYLFWAEHVRFKKVLIFQHDSEIFKPLDKCFLEYDFVGAPWYKGAFWARKDRAGGNGGLSVRDVQAHYDLTKKGRYNPGQYSAEDIFFSHCLPNVAPYEVCKRFSTETEFQLGTFGAHAINKHLNREQCNQIRNY